jgi:hypothetical protein
MRRDRQAVEKKAVPRNAARTIMKRNVALIVSLLICGWPLSPCPAAPAAETQRLYLSGTDKDHTVPWDFQIDGGRSNGVWTTIAVPSCWELQGFGTFRYGHEDKPFAPMHASYRHRFTPPADWAGRRIFLVFDGVMTDCDARLNGASTGGVHQGAFYRFKREVTALLKPGQENLLEVAVSDKSADESVNRAERYADFWVFGGIFRPVWLEAQPQQFIARVAIDARADGAFALEVFPGGSGAADTVEVQVLDPRGQPLGAPLTAPVAAQRLAGKFAGAPTWTAETPRLCTAVVRLKQGATVLHEIKQRRRGYLRQRPARDAQGRLPPLRLADQRPHALRARPPAGHRAHERNEHERRPHEPLSAGRAVPRSLRRTRLLRARRTHRLAEVL